MDLNELLVFAKVVQAGSFIGASRQLDMPKSTVSRKVSELERRLGAQLLHRTTRKLSLTDVGHAFYQHAARVVEQAEEAELAVGRLQELPRGALRVTTPLSFGYLAPIVASFLTRYPDVRLELVCADRVVDLIQEGFDLAVRAGRLADSTLIARSLGTLRSYLVASPTFVKEKGMPKEPQDLEGFDCVVFGGGGNRAIWKLRKDKKTLAVDVRPRLIANDFDFVDEAALSGLAIAMLPLFRCMEHFRTGRLVRVLPEWCSPETPLHAVYPSTRYASPKVKAFLDHLRERIGTEPAELGPAL